jgi:hypothetical protein
LAALKAAADNPEGSFTSAAAEAACPPPAEAGPALAAPAVWAEGGEDVDAGPALAAPAVWAEGGESSAAGLCGCTKPTTTVAVGGLRTSCPANRLPVLSSKALSTGSISNLCALKKSTPKMGKATSAKRNFQLKSRSWNLSCIRRSPQQGIG